MFQGEEKDLPQNHKILAGSSKNSTLKLICLQSKSIAKSQEFSNVHSLFSSGCTRLILLGWGGGLWGGVCEGQKYKKPKWLIFAMFVLVRGGMWGQGLWPGNGQMPHASPMSPLPFFSEKHQTLHDLSLANCMYGNEMIIVDSCVWYF